LTVDEIRATSEKRLASSWADCKKPEEYMATATTSPHGVMEAGGSYNLHAKVPAGGGNLALPYLEEAARCCTLPPGRDPIVIADYGSSQGKNSLAPMRAANLEGAVVGYYTDSNYLFHSFVRNADGTFAAFLAPGQCETNGSQGCYGSEDSNVNAFGLSTGNFMDNTANLVQHGFIRHPNGTFTMFDAPGAGTGQYQGTGCPGCFAGLNQWGAIAGIYADSNTVEHGFLRSPDGKFTTFDAPGAGTGSFQGTGCYSDCPVRLNDWGAITGVYIDANYVYHGYLRSPAGSIVTVDPAGSTFTFPVGINDLGTIVGYYADANGVYHGFLRIRRDK
jgi:hypothetical protein